MLPLRCTRSHAGAWERVEQTKKTRNPLNYRGLCC